MWRLLHSKGSKISYLSSTYKRYLNHNPYSYVGNNFNNQMKKILIVTILLALTSPESCDSKPTISVVNSTNERVVFDMLINENFLIEAGNTALTNPEGRLIISIAPSEKFICGYVTNELQNDLPFDDLKIYTYKDTIFAQTKVQITELFDKNSDGYYKIPYVINIE